MVKLKWSEVGVIDLVLGLFVIFFCFIALAFLYGFLILPATGEALIEREGVRSAFMDFLFIASALLVLGIVGGFELGRYIQTQLIKKKTTSPRTK